MKLSRFIWPVLLLLGCERISTEAPYPQLRSVDAVDSIRSRNIWIEQVAARKRDSIRIVDSLVRIGDTDSEDLRHKKDLFVAYVEVNNRSFKNVTCFQATDGTPLVDLAIIFAPNININPATNKPYIKYNEQVQGLINAGYIQYVKSKGIHVGFDILGNHDRAGFQAFNTLEEATDFARIVATEVRRLGLDAVSFDDEYSAYEQTYSHSFVMLVSEVKRLLPDKLIMCDIYGGAGSSVWDGKVMGDVADLAIPITYPSYFTPGMLNFPASNMLISEKTGGINYGDQEFADLMAQGYRGVMHFDFKTFQFPNYEAYYRSRMQLLKKKDLIVLPGCTDDRELDGINNTIPN